MLCSDHLDKRKGGLRGVLTRLITRKMRESVIKVRVVIREAAMPPRYRISHALTMLWFNYERRCSLHFTFRIVLKFHLVSPANEHRDELLLPADISASDSQLSLFICSPAEQSCIMWKFAIHTLHVQLPCTRDRYLPLWLAVYISEGRRCL